jgi:hypothetical protein
LPFGKSIPLRGVRPLGPLSGIFHELSQSSGDP